MTWLGLGEHHRLAQNKVFVKVRDTLSSGWKWLLHWGYCIFIVHQGSTIFSSLPFSHLFHLRSSPCAPTTHSPLSLSVVPLSASTCSMVHWTTVNPIRGQPPAPPLPHYLALIHQRGSQAVHHPATHPSPIPASAQCCSRGPSWGTARARSLSDDG